jgi:hypothetical protein
VIRLGAQPAAAAAPEAVAPRAPGAQVPWLGRPAAFSRPRLALGLYGLGAGALVGAGLAQGPAGALAALLVALLGLAVLQWPVLGAYMLVAIVPVVSGLRRGLPIPALRLSEVVTVGLAGLLLLSAETRQARPWRLFDWIALAYAAGTLVLGGYDLLHRGIAFTGDNLGTLVGPFQFLILYRAVVTVLRGEEERLRALALVLVASVPVSALAILQYLGLGGVPGVLASATGSGDLLLVARDEGDQRMTGPFPHWQMLAGYLFVIAVVAIAVLLARERRVLPLGWIAAIAALTIGAMVTTGTFVTALGAVAAAVMLAISYRQFGRTTLALGAVAGAGALLFGSLIESRLSYTFTVAPGADRSALLPQSVAYRLQLWHDQLLPALSGHWLTGFGPDLPSSISFQYTESMYLTLLFRGGVPLLLVYAALMLTLGALAFRLGRRRRASDGLVARMVLVLVVLLAVLHLLEPYFITSGLPQLVWLLAGLAVSAEHDRRLP